MITRKQLRRKIYSKSEGWEDVFNEQFWRLPEKLQFDKLYTAATFPTNESFMFWVCQILDAHEPTSDQCCIPEHDYCIFCTSRMPYQGENLEFRLRRKYMRKYCPDCAKLSFPAFCEAHEKEAKNL